MSKKYIVHIGICGFGNQLLGFKELSIIAKYTNRTMVAPIFIPHGTIRDKCKAYYEFTEIFDMNKIKEGFDIIPFSEIKGNVKITQVYNIRTQKEHNLTHSYFQAQRNYYDIDNSVEAKMLERKFITDKRSFEELQNIQDEVLVIIGTFNTIKLSTCAKNGCLNKKCGFHPTFLNEYNTISKHLVFHESIAQISLKTLQSSNIDINELCVFHMRVLDLCQSKTFEYAYNNYDEQKVYNSICQYLYEIGKYNLIQNIFVIAPIQFVTIKNLKLFNTSKIKRINDKDFTEDPFILAMVELYICEKAKVLITSPTNTPNETKEHTRSSFTMNSKTIRDLSKQYPYDICIDDIYHIIKTS
jgi:hypothetical protein